MSFFSQKISHEAMNGEVRDPCVAISVSALFDRIAVQAPARIAVTSAQGHFDYRTLAERSNQLAEHLASMGVGPGVFVGCCVERSFELVVALLAILKAGGAYVPLDPAYPDERLAFMLQDTSCSVVIADTGGAKRLSPMTTALIIEVGSEAQSSAVGKRVCRLPDARTPAYVMYTSGSTGRPRGVVVEHRSIVRLVHNTDYCSFAADEVWLHAAPLAFDASTLEIWGPLLNGGRLVIAPQRASLEDLGRLIRTEAVTSAWFTSGLFNLMVEQRLADMGSLRQLLAGGDVLSPHHVRQALTALPKCTLINGYGPTENTTFTCCHRLQSPADVTEPVPIGCAIAHTTVYVLDDQMQPVADGELGELYTGGEGVARGYLNDPATTAERFLADPFSLVPGAMMYKTSDLVRRSTDGTVHFVGRADSQIKILGHRIEPGEIEAVLAGHRGVKTGCVIVDTDAAGTKRLIAYYVPSDVATELNALRTFLAEKLPRYMMPALIVPLCAMPLTPIGKIDRAALPRPALTAQPIAVDPNAAVVAHTVEEIIIQAWCQHLARASVGAGDNFFDIGGDSLKLVALHADLERRLAREIGIIDLFEFTTPRALARHLETGASDKTDPGVPQNRAVNQRAAFAQQRARSQRPQGR